MNHKRVTRVMRLQGIRGYVKKRRFRTTIPEPSGHKHPDLLQRDFTAEAPNQRYVGDITYCRTWVGFVHVAFILDVCAHRNPDDQTEPRTVQECPCASHAEVVRHEVMTAPRTAEHHYLPDVTRR